MSELERRAILLTEGFLVMANEHRRDRTIGGFCTKCKGGSVVRWPCRIRQIADELLDPSSAGPQEAKP